MTELIQRLQPYVSHFSLEIPKKCKHGDTVTVGGRITSIVNLTDFDVNEGVYLTIDDDIGEFSASIAPKAYGIYKEKFGDLAIGDTVLLFGRVFCVDTTHSYVGRNGKRVTVDNHKEETKRILVAQVAPLPKEKPKKVVEPKAE